MTAPVQFLPARRGALVGLATAVTLLISFWAAAPAGATVEPEAVDVELVPGGTGYWILDETGVVHAFAGAPALGNAALAGGERGVALSATSTGDGYWVFTDRGRALRFGDAPDLGDVGDLPLNAPVVEAVVTPSGDGFWLVAGDGGVFALGDAPFFGSAAELPLNAPVNGIVPTADGDGYWLVAQDGGIFSYGAAEFAGSAAELPLNAPIAGAIPFGDAYLLFGSDGGVFNYSELAFLGSLGATGTISPAVAITAAADGDRYLVVLADGQAYEFTAALASADDLNGERIGVAVLGGQADLDRAPGTYLWEEPTDPSDPFSADRRIHELTIGAETSAGERSAILTTTGDGADVTYDVSVTEVAGVLEVRFSDARAGEGPGYDTGALLFSLAGPASQPVTVIGALETVDGLPEIGRYFDRTFRALVEGDDGRRVAALQASLNDYIGYADLDLDVIREDGVFGPTTRVALLAFEADAQRPRDGVASRADLQALDIAIERLESQADASVVTTGNSGRSVEIWQTNLDLWLRATDTAPGSLAVDGVFGSSTEQATRAFERAEGLQVDGIVEPEDRAAMRAALGRLADAEDDVIVTFDAVPVELATACELDVAAVRIVLPNGDRVIADALAPQMLLVSGDVARTADAVDVQETIRPVMGAVFIDANGSTTVSVAVLDELPSC